MTSSGGVIPKNNDPKRNVDKNGHICAITVDITDEVLDKIAERVINKLFERSNHILIKVEKKE